MSIRPAVVILFLLIIQLFITNAIASGIDLSKAVVIGKGPKKVIEFTDPDCPFCRKASEYFHKRTDVTRYVFFTPLAMHPNARKKVQHILSGNDKAKLYYEVMSGSLDRIDNSKITVTESGIKLLEEQQAIAKSSKIDATPTFMVMGRIVEGFDLPKIEELLGK